MGEILSKLRALPDRWNKGYTSSFINADLRGNSEFPQIHSAQTIRGGATVVRNIADGSLTWDSFVNAELTQRQLRVVRQRVFKTHFVFGIPYLPEKIGKGAVHSFQRKYPDLYVRFLPDSSMAGVIEFDKLIIIRTACQYASAIVPTELQPPPVIPQKLQERLDASPSANANEYNIPLLTLFFTDPIYKHDVDSLIAMWQTAAKILQTDEVKKMGTSFRNSVRKREAGFYPSRTLLELKSVMKAEFEGKFPDVKPDVQNRFIADLTA